jgi:hypothetical protein
VTSRIVRLLTVLSLFVTLTACTGGPRDTYTQNNGSYLKLPGEWELFTGPEIVLAQNPDAELAQGVQIGGFALGSDDPNVVMSGTEFPAGILLSAAIPEGTAPELDRVVVVSNLDELITAGQAKVVEDFTTFESGDTTIGMRAVFDIPDLDGDLMRLTQLTVTDKERTQIWVLIVGCTPECFESQRALIDKISSTWKVEPK